MFYLQSNYMPFMLGDIRSFIRGGSYYDKPAHYAGVNLAEELKTMPADVVIPTEDFSIPEMTIFKDGLKHGLLLLSQKKSLYVGCMGGIGRTGLYLAGLAKIMIEAGEIHGINPIEYVRLTYFSLAIEEPAQVLFLECLEIKSIVDWFFNK